MPFKRFFYGLLNAVFIALGVFYGVNSAIIFMAQPANIQYGEEIQGASKLNGISVFFLDDLKSGGLGNLSVGALGYVNVLSPETLMYLDREFHVKPAAQKAYVIKHETAHILQKQMIAEEVGGYPSMNNPWRSFAYYQKVVQLDVDYAAIMPGLHSELPPVWFSGLETSADCYSQVPGAHHPLSYIGREDCSREQWDTAASLDSTQWPIRKH